MSGGRWLLRLGDFLVSRAARRLPAAVRDERCREWAAELPVILSDPEVKPAVARAGRMLWFAADTWRGTTLGHGRAARHRGTHRGRAGVAKNARSLGVLAAALTAMAALLAAGAFLIYESFAGSGLTYYATVFLGSLINCGSWLIQRRHGGLSWYRSWSWCWLTVGATVMSTAEFASVLARHYSWGHPLLFTFTSDCGYAVFAACTGVVAVSAIRSAARRVRRSGSSP